MASIGTSKAATPLYQFKSFANGLGQIDGPAGTTRFAAPIGITVDSTGNVYVADYGNGVIRKIRPAGAVTTLAGWAGAGGGCYPGSAVCNDGTGVRGAL